MSITVQSIPLASQHPFAFFAWARSASYNQRFVIIVAGGYGAFLFRGCPEEAERMRVHKSNWEGAIARLRPAALDETEENVSQCWNHPLFKNRFVYADCKCGSCE